MFFLLFSVHDGTTVSSTEQCDHLLIFRVTLEAIRGNSKKHHQLSVERPKLFRSKPKPRARKIWQNWISGKTGQRDRSNSIVTLIHSTGQHYGFAFTGGSSHKKQVK